MRASIEQSGQSGPAAVGLRPPTASGRTRWPASGVRWIGAFALIGGLAACREVPLAFGPDPAAARTSADQFLRSLVHRFTDVSRTAKFAAARPRLARHALSPSGIYDDTSVWTSPPSQPVRTLSLWGGLTRGPEGRLGYVFDARPAVPVPVALGAARHEMRLRRDGDGAFTWWTDVDQAMGPMHAEAAGKVLAAFLAGGEGHDAAQIRAGYATLFPRTTRHLATLFSLDSLRVQRYADGSHAVSMRARLQAARLGGAGYPNFERYVRKYVAPARFRFALRDPRGVLYFDAAARDERFDIHLRTQGGKLVSLNGPARPLPDDLRLHQEASMKAGLFRVGFRDLVSEMRILRGAHERAWELHWRKEPQWEFPLAVNNLIRTPLRHPFAGEGMFLRIALEEHAGGQTILVRRSRVAVKESAIVRWLGGLGNDAMSDFAGKAEAEENRWLAELFDALRLDSTALLAAQCRATAGVSCEE